MLLRFRLPRKVAEFGLIFSRGAAAKAEGGVFSMRWLVAT
jgi:hypothetical protein